MNLRKKTFARAMLDWLIDRLVEMDYCPCDHKDQCKNPTCHNCILAMCREIIEEQRENDHAHNV